jgi:hypothetical protein
MHKRRKKSLNILIALGLFSFLGIFSSKPALADGDQVTVTSNSMTRYYLRPGQSTSVQGMIANYNWNKTENVLFDIEIFDSQNKKVAQNFVENVNLGSMESKNFEWKINEKLPPGFYRVSFGIFNPNWQGLRSWYDTYQNFTIAND